MSVFWVIRHGDPELARPLYWIGYDRVTVPRDHRFSTDLREAVRFSREVDARRAGVHLTKGIKIERCELDD